jgi:hypothetical protein
MRMLLLIVVLLAAGAWFVPQVQEGTDGPCPALEQKVRSTIRGNPRVAREVAAVTAKQLEQVSHGGACVVAWWRLAMEHGLER